MSTAATGSKDVPGGVRSLQLTHLSELKRGNLQQIQKHIKQSFTPVTFWWNHILSILSLVTQSCTNNSYSLNGNTLHYWLSYYEDYRHFEGILSKESFELYVIVLDDIFTRDLWETPKIFKMTLIINDNLSSIYQFSCSIPLLSFDHASFYFVYV